MDRRQVLPRALQLAQIGHLYTTFPWAVSEFEDTKSLMGEDYWRYGIEENAGELDAMTRYSFDQGLSARRLTPEDIFAAPTFDLGKL